MDINKKISTIIRERREELGLSQQDVATYIGVNRSSVSLWESGDIKNMGRDKIKKLSEILQISPITLITGETDHSSEPLSKEEIITLAAHNEGYQGQLSSEDMDRISLAIKIALAKK